MHRQKLNEQKCSIKYMGKKIPEAQQPFKQMFQEEEWAMLPVGKYCYCIRFYR